VLRENPHGCTLKQVWQMVRPQPDFKQFTEQQVKSIVEGIQDIKVSMNDQTQIYAIRSKK